MKKANEILSALHTNCEDACEHTDILLRLCEEYANSPAFTRQVLNMIIAMREGFDSTNAWLLGLVANCILAGVKEGRRLAEVEALNLLHSKDK